MNDEKPMGQVIRSMKPGFETISVRWSVARWKRR